MKQMKGPLLIFTALCCLFCGCSEEFFNPEDTEIETAPEGKAGETLIVRIVAAETTTGETSHVVNPIAFTGNDILWFNETTNELRFKDNQSMVTSLLKSPGFSNTGLLKFYIGDEYLFTSNIYVNSTTSQIYNSLVFFYNQKENKFFLLESYPPVANFPNLGVTSDSQRGDIKSNVSDAWNKFISQLKSEGRYNK